MKKLDNKIKIIASAAAVLIGFALIGGATFAWLNISKAPKINKVRTLIANTSIVEIALADSKKISFATKKATGPDEVGENDIAKGQVTWGRIVTMEDNPIILQAPATFDSNKGISTAAFSEEDGRPIGFESLTHGEITPEGLVYYKRKANIGENYVDQEGHIVEATSSESGYAAAGGVAVWMRTNAEAQIDLLLKGTSVVNAEEDIPIELFAKVWRLNPQGTDQNGAQTGTLQELGTFMCTKTKDKDGNEGFVSTLTNEDWNKMIPGVQYLVELICYIEGDREKNDNALISQSMGNGAEGREIKVEFGDVSYDTLSVSPYVTIADAKTGGQAIKFGRYYTATPSVAVGIWSDTAITEADGIEIGYDLKEANSATISETLKLKNKDEKLNITLGNGVYTLQVWMTDTVHKTQSGEKQKLYAINFNTRYLINTKPSSLHVTVDTVPPTIEYTSPENDTYTNADSVAVKVTVVEDNVKRIRIGGTAVKGTPSTITDEDGNTKTAYLAEKEYKQEGEYVIKKESTGVTDQANQEVNVSSDLRFVIDRTKPVIEDLKWTFINHDALSQILNWITLENFFTEKIMIEATAKDEHLESYSVTPDDTGKACDVYLATASDGKSCKSTILVDADFPGKLNFLAADKAGNAGMYETELLQAGGLKTVVEKDNRGWKGTDGIVYALTPDDDNKFDTDHYEYSLDEGTNWYRTGRTEGDLIITVEAAEGDFGNIIEGAVIKVQITDGKSIDDGKIRFRAMTRALSTGDFDVYSEVDTLPGEATGDDIIKLDRTHSE